MSLSSRPAAPRRSRYADDDTHWMQNLRVRLLEDARGAAPAPALAPVSAPAGVRFFPLRHGRASIRRVLSAQAIWALSILLVSSAAAFVTTGSVASTLAFTRAALLLILPVLLLWLLIGLRARRRAG